MARSCWHVALEPEKHQGIAGRPYSAGEIPGGERCDPENYQFCDKADGVADGLIQNPAKCTFQPDALVPETLTQKQADALKLIMSPVRDEQGKLIYPGASVGNLGQENVTVRGATNYLETPPSDPKSAKPWGDAVQPANWSLAQNILMKLGYYDAGKDMNNSIESNGVVKSDALNLVYTRLAADIPTIRPPSARISPRAVNC